MPAQRHQKRKLNRQEKLKNNKKHHKLKLFLVISLVVGILFIKALFTPKNFTGEKVVVSVFENDNSVSVVVYDPPNSEITKINIPGDLSIEAAQGLGVWKLGRVWKLGENNGGEGELLTRTITASLKFPVYLYAKAEGQKIIGTNPISVFTAFGNPFETNLTTADKIAIALFAMNVKNVDRREIDLTKTQLLEKSVLTDGTKGYEIGSGQAPGVYALFTSNLLASDNLKVSIKDGAENKFLAQKVGAIVETLGGRVLTISSDKWETGCLVTSINADAGRYVSKILRCDYVKSNPSDNYDLEIKLGKDFVL